MRRPLLALLALTLTLSACGGIRESRLNPFNWFGRSEARQVSEVDRFQVQADPRPLVDQVTAMEVERLPGGAILRATGLPPAQGFWDAELVPYRGTTGNPVDAGVLVYDFRLAPPPYRTRIGTPFSREIEVATYLTENDLAGIRRIVIRGMRTERSVAR